MRHTRLHRLAAVLAAAFALSFAPSPPAAHAQGSAPTDTAVTQSAPAGALPAAPAPAPPRTLRAYWHVFIAFTLAWLFLFAYAISLGRRFRKLEQDVDSLRGTS